MNPPPLKHLWLDIETTGTDPFRDKIREIAMLCGNKQVWWKFGTLSGMRTFDSQERLCARWIKTRMREHGVSRLRLAGYNVGHDVRWLKSRVFPEWHDVWLILDSSVLDVLALARRHKAAYGFPDCRLHTVADCLGLAVTTKHYALGCAKLARGVYRRLKT